jgi:hypothetical protein
MVTSPRQAWRWVRDLPQNPIYLRERGSWGNPNPFFDNLKRFSPFVILGTISLGLCAGYNPSLMAGFGNDDVLALVWCLVCLPGIMLSMITIFASLMVPALTAPAISMEQDKGTWDVLRMTPYSTHTILLAKLFGALSRLRIWPVLLVLTLLQGLMMGCLMTLAGGETAVIGWLLGLSTFTRPWLEILFAAFTGMYFSTLVRSATVALASAYTAVILFRLLNSSGLWVLGTSLMNADDIWYVVNGTIGPVFFYTIAVLLLWLGLLGQAKKLSDT